MHNSPNPSPLPNKSVSKELTPKNCFGPTFPVHNIKLTPLPSTNLRTYISGIATEYRKAADHKWNLQIILRFLKNSNHIEFMAPLLIWKGREKVGLNSEGCEREHTVLPAYFPWDWRTISFSPHLVVTKSLLIERQPEPGCSAADPCSDISTKWKNQGGDGCSLCCRFSSSDESRGEDPWRIPFLLQYTLKIWWG